MQPGTAMAPLRSFRNLTTVDPFSLLQTRLNRLFEPFADTYYFSKVRFTSMYGDKPEVWNRDFDCVVAEIASIEAPMVFVKEMAYFVTPYLTDDFLNSGTHTFIIRDPILTLASRKKERRDQWVSFSDPSSYRSCAINFYTAPSGKGSERRCSDVQQRPSRVHSGNVPGDFHLGGFGRRTCEPATHSRQQGSSHSLATRRSAHS